MRKWLSGVTNFRSGTTSFTPDGLTFTSDGLTYASDTPSCASAIPFYVSVGAAAVPTRLECVYGMASGVQDRLCCASAVVPDAPGSSPDAHGVVSCA